MKSSLWTVVVTIVLCVPALGLAGEVWDRTFVVSPSASGWQSTGLYVRPGDRFYIFADGVGFYSSGSQIQDMTFVGQPSGAGDYSPATSVEGLGLVAKVGDGSAFGVSSAFVRPSSPWSGELRLGFNDTQHDDNRGYFVVGVIVIRDCTAR